MDEQATLDSTENDIREAALRADRGEPADSHSASPDTEAQTSPEHDQTPPDEGSDESQESVQQKAETQTEKKPVAKPEQPKPESNFAKKQKEQARLETNWKKFHTEKEQERAKIAAERAAIERERAELQALRSGATTQKPSPQGPGAEAYDALARKYADEGNAEMEKLARDKAEELRAQAQQAAAQPAQANRPADPTSDPQFKAEWNKQVQELVQQHPNLTDPADPVGKQTMGLINHPNYGRFLRAHPDGIKMAHEVAGLIHRAGRVPALEKELTSAKAEVERLTKLTSLRGGPPPSHTPTAKTIGEMKGEEAEDFVRQMAMKADRGDV